jgi:hypothetical protein
MTPPWSSCNHEDMTDLADLAEGQRHLEDGQREQGVTLADLRDQVAAVLRRLPPEPGTQGD